MSAIQVQQAGSNYTTITTNAEANTGVLRDGSGGILGVQVQGSELKTTGNLTLQYVAKAVAFTADTSGTYFSCDATSAAFAVTLPPAATVTGRVYVFKKIDSAAHNVTVTGNGAETIDGSNTKALTSQYAKTMIISNGVGWDILV